MTALLDVNVLVALAWPNHIHHEAVLSWFREQREAGWVTCALTEAGFVRVSCNPSAVRYAVTPADAIALLGELRRLGAHSFWSLDRSLTDLPQAIAARIQGYRQITDAVLVAAALRYGGRLATLDHGLAQLVGTRERSALIVIPV